MHDGDQFIGVDGVFVQASPDGILIRVETAGFFVCGEVAKKVDGFDAFVQEGREEEGVVEAGEMLFDDGGGGGIAPEDAGWVERGEGLLR